VRHDVRSENQEGLPSRQPKRTTARTAAATTAAVHHPTFSYFLTVNSATIRTGLDITFFIFPFSFFIILTKVLL
jgi:hypothetical protein